MTGPTKLTDLEAGLTVTVPVAVYLITVWALHIKYRSQAFFATKARRLRWSLFSRRVGPAKGFWRRESSSPRLSLCRSCSISGGTST